MKNDFRVSHASKPHACGGIMRAKNRIIRNERTLFLYFFVHHVRTPRRHRCRFFMMYTTVFLLCVVCVCACLKGLPDATSITPISLYVDGWR